MKKIIYKICAVVLSLAMLISVGVVTGVSVNAASGGSTASSSTVKSDKFFALKVGTDTTFGPCDALLLMGYSDVLDRYNKFQLLNLKSMNNNVSITKIKSFVYNGRSYGNIYRIVAKKAGKVEILMGYKDTNGSIRNRTFRGNVEKRDYSTWTTQVFTVDNANKYDISVGNVLQRGRFYSKWLFPYYYGEFNNIISKPNSKYASVYFTQTEEYPGVKVRALKVVVKNCAETRKGITKIIKLRMSSGDIINLRVKLKYSK